MYIHMCMFTYTHTHTYIYLYIDMRRWPEVLPDLASASSWVVLKKSFTKHQTKKKVPIELYIATEAAHLSFKLSKPHLDKKATDKEQK